MQIIFAFGSFDLKTGDKKYEKYSGKSYDARRFLRAYYG